MNSGSSAAIVAALNCDRGAVIPHVEPRALVEFRSQEDKPTAGEMCGYVTSAINVVFPAAAGVLAAVLAGSPLGIVLGVTIGTVLAGVFDFTLSRAAKFFILQQNGFGQQPKPMST